jgi:hypothetical protein
MPIPFQIWLPRQLKQQFDSYIPGQGVEQDYFVIDLISDYVTGKIQRDQIKGQDRPREVPAIIYIMGLHADEVWSRFQEICANESKDPFKVIVDLIDFGVNSRGHQR